MALFLRIFLMFTALSLGSFTRYMEKTREARERMQQQYYEQQLEVYGQQGNEVEETKTPKLVVDVDCPKKPEVYRVALEDTGSDGNLGNSKIRNVYEIDYMSSGVVGLVGAPVEVSYSKEEAKAKITFYYDKDELRGIPERNLIILHEVPSGSYEQVGVEQRDTDKGTISVEIPEAGIYLLADYYQWYGVWGVDVSDYAYEVDPLTIKSDWERSCEVGSILEIADKEWAIQNAPVFHVSTPEQLAGVVYYNNAVMEYSVYGGSLEVYLENDIDLAGYEWVPMGWLGPMDSRFDGLIDGQGHTIKNMTIHTAYYDHCAFIGYSTGVTVKNITFENAEVGGGRYVGIVGGEIYMSREWEKVRVQGVLVNATGEYGSIIGREAYLNFKDCEADVVRKTADGSESRVEYFSHRLEVLANTPVSEDFELTLNDDGSVTRTEAEGQYRNLMWHLDVEGVQILQRGAEDELTLDVYGFFADYLYEGLTCRIWLDAFTGETYTRVSNVLEYQYRR
ncbi:MAG: hypothetical protein J6Z22_07020 [Lachnospiraceae bacterium]|nr:hypothetical protein [Lachnospiraceae bacterium]